MANETQYSIPTLESIRTSNLTAHYKMVLVLESEKLYKVWISIFKPIIIRGIYPGASRSNKYFWLNRIHAVVGDETKLYINPNEYDNYYTGEYCASKYKYKINYPWNPKLESCSSDIFDFAINKCGCKNSVDFKACWNYLSEALEHGTKYSNAITVCQYMDEAIEKNNNSQRKEIENIVNKYIKPISYTCKEAEINCLNGRYTCTARVYINKTGDTSDGRYVNVELYDTCRDNTKTYYFKVTNSVDWSSISILPDKLEQYIDTVKKFIEAKYQYQRECSAIKFS